MAMQCPICGLVLLILKLYVSHLRLVHAKDPNFNLMCGVGGCREVFRAFSAFNSHIYRHHREAIGIDSADHVECTYQARSDFREPYKCHSRPVGMGCIYIDLFVRILEEIM